MLFSLPPLPTWDGLHPLVTHFPIALLLVAPLFVVLGLFRRPSARAFLLAALLLMVLGTTAIFVAVPTGEAAGRLACRDGDEDRGRAKNHQEERGQEECASRGAAEESQDDEERGHEEKRDREVGHERMETIPGGKGRKGEQHPSLRQGESGPRPVPDRGPSGCASVSDELPKLSDDDVLLLRVEAGDALLEVQIRRGVAADRADVERLLRPLPRGEVLEGVPVERG